MLKLHNTLLLAVNETNYGISATSQASDAILVRELEFSPIETEQFPYVPLNGRLGSYRLLHSAERGRIRFRMDLERSESPNNTPPVGKLLKACGFKEATTTSTYLYSLSESQTSLSLFLYCDGVLHSLKGCLGNVRIYIEMHQPPSLEFEFLGLWQTPNIKSLPSVNYNAYTTPILASSSNISLELSNTELPASSIMFDVGNSLEFQETFHKKQIVLTDRRALGNIQFLAENNYQPSADLKNNTDLSLKATINNAGKKIILTLPHIQWRSKSMAQEQGQWTNRLELSINDNLQNVSPISISFEKGSR